MEIETSRYLLSALIQVFGALIVIGGMFLLFKHESLDRRFDDISFELGKILYIIFKYSCINDKLRQQEVVFLEREGLEFRSKNLNERNEVIQSVSDRLIYLQNGSTQRKNDTQDSNLDTKIEGYEIARKYLSIRLNWYRNIENKINSIYPMIYKIMGLPAGLCIVFSIILFSLDVIAENKLLLMNIYSVALAVCSFILLIYWAASVLKEN